MTSKLAISLPSNPTLTRMDTEFLGFIRDDYLYGLELVIPTKAGMTDFKSGARMSR